MSSAEVKAVITAVTHLGATRYMQAAAISLLTYDYFLTLEDEVKYFWHGQRTWGSILFFANRYFSIIAVSLNTAALFSPVVTQKVCFIWIHYLLTGFGIVEILIVQAILIGRIQAMYRNNQKLIYAISTLYVICGICGSVIVALTVRHTEVTSSPFPGLVVCAPVNSVANLWTYSIPVLTVDIILFCLAIFKTLSYIYKTQFRGHSSKAAQILEVMMRDSILYFLIILALYTADTFLWRFGSPTLLNLLISMAEAMMSISCSRMMINLRALGAGNRISNIPLQITTGSED